MSFDESAGQLVCRVDVQRGAKPTFVRGSKGEADLYVRLNNGTRLLNTADALEYTQQSLALIKAQLMPRWSTPSHSWAIPRRVVDTADPRGSLLQ